MHRLERLRATVDDILRAQPDDDRRRCGFVHLYGVAATGAQLALQRGLDAELCAVAGMLHDIATYRTGDPTDHAARSAADARELLTAAGDFSAEEIATVCAMIAHHSDKAAIHDAPAELLKDADVLQHYLYNPWLPPYNSHAARRRRLQAELGLAGRPYNVIHEETTR